MKIEIDKYDFILVKEYIIENLKRIYKERKNIYPNYLRWKKEKLLMESYYLINKRYVRKSKEKGTDGSLGIEKAFDLDLGARYMWDLLKPMKEPKKEA